MPGSAALDDAPRYRRLTDGAPISSLMSPRRVAAAVAIVVAVAAAFLGGVIVGGHAEATGLTQLNDPLRSLLLGGSGKDLSTQVLGVLRDDYYVPVDSTRLERDSVQGIVDALGDPYTDYLDPDELAALRRSYDGAYVGIGIRLIVRDGTFVVAAVNEGGPAARAKVLVGDRLISVDGRPTAGRNLQSVSDAVRGDEGTVVRIAVATGSAPPRTLALTRADIQVSSVESRAEMVGGTRVGYLRLARFTRGSADALRSAVAAARGTGASALVLDLRGDPGGLVTEAVGVAGVFLPKRSTVVVTEGLHSPRHVYRTDSAPAAGDLPLVVLVDRGSASASEIVAGALRDATRGRLVGDRTFGKALVQKTIPLRDGGALKLTTARYLTPAGYDLAKRGIPPAVRVSDDPATSDDEVLQRGLELAAAAG